ncbi:MAG: hypothetical protein DWQ09_12645 [Proteobacteria bacterium]|nr:MAG: hypothetical protein DWQ09_12645 [Pseudomonadota bacterium]
MRPNSSAIGLLALCGVLATSIIVPLSQPHARIEPSPPERSSFDYLPLSASGTTLLERKGINVLAIHTRSAEELDALFQDLDFKWPFDASVEIPPLEVTALPLDLDQLDVRKKKSVFFRTLLPLVAMENRIIREQRDFIKQAFRDGPLAPDSKVAAAIEDIAKHYRVTGDLNSRLFRESLMRRVDVVPAGLVLAQAANESGWGTSRFAQNANNLFGVWTYKRRAGMAPIDRDEGAKHAVRAYPSLRRAVRSYLFNINVGHAYQELRQLRAAMRQAGEPLDAHELAAGLVRYSSRGEAYVEEIRRLIRINKLNDMVNLRLTTADKP